MSSDSLHSGIFERIATPMFTVLVGDDGDLTLGSVNPAFERVTGLREWDVSGKPPQDLPVLAAKELESLRESCGICLKTGGPVPCELVLEAPGKITSWPVLLSPVRSDAGQIALIVGSIVGSSHPSSEQQRAENDLRRSRDLLRAIIDAAPTPIIGLDLDGHVDTVWNRAAENLLGWTAQEAMGRPLPSVPVDSQHEFAGFRELIRKGMTLDGVEARRLRRDGTPVDYSIYASPLYDAEGRVTGNIAVLVDMTERRQAEDALRRSEWEKTILNRIANVFLTVSDEAMYGEVLAIFLEAMASTFGIFGYLAEDGDLVIPSLTREVWNECEVAHKSVVFPAESWGSSLWGRAIREKKAFRSEGPFRVPEGHIHIDNFLTAPIVYGDATIGVLSVANKAGGYDDKDQVLLERIAHRVSPILHARLQRDTQERRRLAAEADLRESEEKYRLLITHAEEAIFIVQDEVVKFPNPRALEMSGYSTEELAQMPFQRLVHPAHKSAVVAGYSKMLRGERLSEIHPFRIVDRSGKEMWVQLTAAPITWEKKAGILCLVRDITDERKLQMQFAQAQKMEAVGRVAGGVAHDFNNMLTVIIGNTELALMNLKPSDALWTDLQEIDEVARRSADLTRQLLGFARRQTIAPKVLDLNDAVSTMLEMLRRLVGEDVDLAWQPGRDLWHVKMDPSQIDQVLANLCVNARDAITGVGSVTIETGNAVFDEDYCRDHPGSSPGEYVLLAVSDDGCGMDQEVKTHLFEPFFTTKGQGHGTGLGLATVYGIVRQNDGFINVYSEVAQGTTFMIYFPRYEAEPAELQAAVTQQAPLEGREVVLIVEDERSILNLGKRILEKLGYTVLIARTPGRAIRLVEEYPREIDLLITDVVMPEMDGRSLAETLSATRPGLKCLFMSGYTANVIAHRGVLEEGVHFIQKPFSARDLAVQVREVLDGK